MDVESGEGGLCVDDLDAIIGSMQSRSSKNYVRPDTNSTTSSSGASSAPASDDIENDIENQAPRTGLFTSGSDDDDFISRNSNSKNTGKDNSSEAVQRLSSSSSPTVETAAAKAKKKPADFDGEEDEGQLIAKDIKNGVGE
jgi:hypothetical protein